MVVLLNSSAVFAQSAEKLYGEGQKLEQQFKPAEALEKYALALQQDPHHLNSLIRASRMTCNVAAHLPDKDERRKRLAEAEELSRRALALSRKNVEAHFSMVVVMGLMAEAASSPREKIKNAEVIRRETEEIIKLDSNYALAYFVLGKWHYELSKLNWFERTACELFFGGLPNGISMKESLKNFQKALELDPEQIIILFGHATSLHYEGRDKEAIAVLEKALSLPVRDMDDEHRKGRCRELLQEIKG
jgi:tetratricopeptide (TPR) repeat protein